ncbi:hypothetical protein RRG08_027714 [Elysia crispata]|uniref:Uncharacterized protein n=1 Tax=Elysia crispata TaxID=231223 RepID=A0AAE0XM86_9GAST|nr:hypothetical protein RRG08_027714 [Elysia crispata]
MSGVYRDSTSSWFSGQDPSGGPTDPKEDAVSLHVSTQRASAHQIRDERERRKNAQVFRRTRNTDRGID